MLVQVARDFLPRDVRGNCVQLGGLTAKFIYGLGNECLAHEGVILDQHGRSAPEIYLSITRTRILRIPNEPKADVSS